MMTFLTVPKVPKAAVTALAKAAATVVAPAASTLPFAPSSGSAGQIVASGIARIEFVNPDQGVWLPTREYCTIHELNQHTSSLPMAPIFSEIEFPFEDALLQGVKRLSPCPPDSYSVESEEPPPTLEEAPTKRSRIWQTSEVPVKAEMTEVPATSDMPDNMYFQFHSSHDKPSDQLLDEFPELERFI